jgi:hypothetical protein
LANAASRAGARSVAIETRMTKICESFVTQQTAEEKEEQWKEIKKDTNLNCKGFLQVAVDKSWSIPEQGEESKRLPTDEEQAGQMCKRDTIAYHVEHGMCLYTTCTRSIVWIQVVGLLSPKWVCLAFATLNGGEPVPRLD